MHTITGSRVFRDTAFPIGIVRVNRHGVSQMHNHEFMELVLILKGSGLHVTEVEQYPIGAGDVFVISPGQLHGYQQPVDLALINILFDLQRLGLPLQDLANLPGYHALFQVEPKLRRQHQFKSRLRLGMDELGLLVDEVASLQYELSSHEPGSNFMATAHLMRIIGQLARSYSKSEQPEIRPVMGISKVISYLERNYAEQIRLQHLATLAHMSQSSLLRTFDEVVGRSPIDYLIQLRISKAASLLKTTSLQITEIAACTGFSDSNYFARQFKQSTGFTPRTFRKTQHAQISERPPVSHN